MSVEQQPRSSVGASAAAIQHHYDVSNEFYALWLDPTMTYSCALWDGDDDTLQAALERKLDYYIEGAQAAGKRRVLDVGCGWGSLLFRATGVHGAGHGTGLTLSEAQAEHVRAKGDPAVEVRVESWEDHVADEPYDAIVSLGAMEHFVPPLMPRREKVEAYRKFFVRCHEMLRPGGMMGLQTIARGNTPVTEEDLQEFVFIFTKIFPESDVPRFAEVAHAAEKRFEILTVRNDRDHYARTCEVWLENLQANRKAALALVGEQGVADYERYLRSSQRQLATGQVTLLRFLMRRV